MLLVFLCVNATCMLMLARSLVNVHCVDDVSKCYGVVVMDVV